MWAYDADAAKMWIWVCNGTWYFSGDPAAGTNANVFQGKIYLLLVTILSWSYTANGGTAYCSLAVMVL